MTDTATHQGYSLDARWDPQSGPVVLTGVQAVARLLVEQHVRDSRNGLRTASFVSGYQGSPLAGLDKVLAGAGVLRDRHDMTLVPGLNEELAATSVWGSQSLLPNSPSRYDGVVGLWYGKAPGVDRTGDAFRHANLAGASPTGGVLVLAGDDPAAKSSTVPCASEQTLAALSMPVLYPRNAEEVVTLGLYGVALSRASGCWTALKIVADVADGLWTVDRDFGALDISVPELTWQGQPWTFSPNHQMLPPYNLASEAQLAGPRWEMVNAFAEANPLNVVEVDPSDAWLGIAAAGKTYDDTVQALRDLGLDRAGLRRAGVRLLRIGLPYPLPAGVLRTFARGLEHLLVVEEKGAFIETQVRDRLYGGPSTPTVWGKRCHEGDALVPADGELTATRLQEPLRRVLRQRLSVPDAPRSPVSLPLLPVARTPYFCSGCPHNRSTVVPEGSVAAGGIGCHAMTALSGRVESAVTGLTQMGGEGAQWIGQAPFVETNHIFQNLGDGTFFHSGQLAVQACVAAGVNVTFKLLYNATVAMTGGQDATGAREVADVATKLLAEGVRRVMVVADEPERYRRVRMPKGVPVWHRDRLDEAQRQLRDVSGVTVLVYDQECAAEARRLRKRGKIAARPQRVVINEQVCEGCGDCGAKSNCLSVQPVDTELGRKTRIDQDSCNTDYSCLDGDCPSFITLRVKERRGQRATGDPDHVPEPERPKASATRPFNVLLAGIGGTGIVTVNQLLATAARLDGLSVRGLDQTGLSQKAGPVTSHLRIGAPEKEPANRVGTGQADCLLAFDLLVGADAKQLASADPRRTFAFVSTSPTPTGAMVRNPDVAAPDPEALLTRLTDQVCRVHTMDSLAAADRLLGSAAAANLLLVGAAYQAGALPITADSVEAAIRLNGVAVDANIKAFRWGRLAVHDPGAFAIVLDEPSKEPPVDPWVTHQLDGSQLAGETRRLVEVRATQLLAYQGKALAREYLSTIERAWNAQRSVGPDTRFTEELARGLHKLMTYKDEYEVARLLTDKGFLQSLAAQFPDARKVQYRLHPPALRALGMKRKLALGPAWRPMLRLLAHGKWLRGTALDPFGRMHIRKVERELLRDYDDRITALVAKLDPASYELAVAVAGAPELVRGYEDVKLRNIQKYRVHLDQVMERSSS